MDWRRSAAVPLLLVFVLSRLFWTVLNGAPYSTFNSASSVGLLKVGLWVVPALLLVACTERFRPGAALRSLSLDAGLVRGCAFGIAATLPMALVIPLGGRPDPRPEVIVDTLLLGPFAEEILFRGVLLGWLIHRAGWRPVPAILVSATLFGLAHVPETTSFPMGLLIPPLLGGVLFGWVYYRWGSLWPAIGLHASINLWWDLSVGRPFPLEALQMAHGVAVILAVVLTLRFTTGPAKQTRSPAAVQPPGPPISP